MVSYLAWEIPLLIFMILGGAVVLAYMWKRQPNSWAHRLFDRKCERRLGGGDSEATSGHDMS
jgi:hypothetical protein